MTTMNTANTIESAVSTTGRIGCVKAETSGKDHQMQLWIHGQGGSYYYEIRQAYMPAGRLLRSCSLDTGKARATYQQAETQGLEALERLLKS